jgi:hypothetical protein
MKQNLPGGNSAVVPPDPMPNSEVKRRSADGSVGSPHARVGHCQASNLWADMAQLVERTLGKGEVPSSTLGISTTLSK